MHLRIVSRSDNLGRRFYVEREEKTRIMFWDVWKVWVNVGSVIGYKTESEAKEFAEDHAKGDWVSDSAKFNRQSQGESR